MPSGASPAIGRPSNSIVAFGRRREPGDQLEQRRLAAAGGPDHREELALADLEVDGSDRMQRRRRAPVANSLADIFEPDLRSHGWDPISQRGAETPEDRTLCDSALFAEVLLFDRLEIVGAGNACR